MAVREEEEGCGEVARQIVVGRSQLEGERRREEVAEGRREWAQELHRWWLEEEVVPRKM